MTFVMFETANRRFSVFRYDHPMQPLPAILLAAAVRFTDVTPNSGVDFVHRNGASGTKYAVELIGAGGALLDWDGDGDLDLFLVQGAGLPGNDYAGAPPSDALYENIGWGSLPGAAGGKPAFRTPFVPVPGAAGAADTSYGMGAVAGDYDNDGDPDLYVTNFGADRLWRNDAGRFTDVTAAAGLGDDKWSTSACWADVDHDGFLDLYVCNYFRYRLEDHEWYGLRKPGWRTHGGPASFKPDVHVLWRNRGDGTFEDVSEPSGVRANGPAFGLGVVAGDFDDDRDIDLFVANDTQPNWLFLNDGRGRFTEDGTLAGVAFDHAGKPQASMGVDAQDANGDLLVDIVCTNFSLEAIAFYLGEGRGFWRDAAWEVGLAEPTLPHLGFGTGFLDVENDRDLDVFAANGHIMDNVELYFDNLTYKERNQLFLNEGGRFVEVGAEAGAIVTQVEASRASLFGDLDDDGDTDLVVTNVAAPPQILRNDTASGNAWVRIQLRGTTANRDGAGADVFVTAAGETRRLQARACSGYLGSNDPRILAGLGEAQTCDIEVRWPRGGIDRVERVPARRTVVVTERQGGRVLPEGLPAIGWAMDEDDL
jgi:hypothetical protein